MERFSPAILTMLGKKTKEVKFVCDEGTSVAVVGG